MAIASVSTHVIRDIWFDSSPATFGIMPSRPLLSCARQQTQKLPMIYLLIHLISLQVKPIYRETGVTLITV